MVFEFATIQNILCLIYYQLNKKSWSKFTRYFLNLVSKTSQRLERCANLSDFLLFGPKYTHQEYGHQWSDVNWLLAFQTKEVGALWNVTIFLFFYFFFYQHKKTMSNLCHVKHIFSFVKITLETTINELNQYLFYGEKINCLNVIILWSNSSDVSQVVFLIHKILWIDVEWDRDMINGKRRKISMLYRN